MFRTKNFKIIVLIVTLVLPGFLQLHAQVESDFFKDTSTSVIVKDLVLDYGVNNQDEQDDSPLLQQAIDEVSALGGGKIMLPYGTYYLMGIFLKDNVHLMIDSATTIVGAAPTGVIFSMGLARKGADALVTIRNVSIRGNGGRYTVDIRHGEVNEKLWFANCRNVDNFMIADFNIQDHYTKMSGVTLNTGWYEDQYVMARNGVVKNGDVVNAHVGYGLIQVQCCSHVLFKNLSGQGGVTLRMESGAVANSPEYILIDDVWGRKISSRYGSSAFIMGAHTKKNGYVNIKNVYTISSGSGGGIGKGYVTEAEAAAGLTPGYFSPDSEVDSVHAVFGYNAQVKWKNFDMVPCPIRHLISDDKTGDSVSHLAPSFAAMSHNDTAISLTNVTWEGFKYQSNLIVSKEDELKDCPPDVITASNTLFEVGHDSGSITIAVASNKEWTVEETENWLDCSPLTGILDDTLLIMYAANSSAEERTATVVLNGGDATETLTLVQAGIPVGIDPVVYPNPASDLIYLTTGVTSSYQIYNLVGSEVRSSGNISDHFEISLAGLENGVYFLKVESEKGNYVKPIIIR